MTPHTGPRNSANQAACTLTAPQTGITGHSPISATDQFTCKVQVPGTADTALVDEPVIGEGVYSWH
jgi:hypothetical protein